MMNPKPIIEVITDQTKYDYENGILKAVQKVGINVDKERLAKALIDSRSFYDEGYADAKAKYENALDNACRMLSAIDQDSKLFKFHKNVDEWKEWSMRDE